MFVHNCRVIETENLFFKAGPKKRGYKTKKQRDQYAISNSSVSAPTPLSRQVSSAIHRPRQRKSAHAR